MTNNSSYFLICNETVIQYGPNDFAYALGFLYSLRSHGYKASLVSAAYFNSN